MKLWSWSFALVAALALAGCGNEPTAPSSEGGANVSGADRQAIEGEMAHMPEAFDSYTYTEPGEEELAYSDPFTGNAVSGDPEPGDRLPFFFRKITHREREVVIRVEDKEDHQIAHVAVFEKMGGSFNIVTVHRDPDTGDVTRHLLQKRLRDVGRRRAVFARPLAPPEGDAVTDAHRHRGWRLAAISHHPVASPEHTADIVALRLQTRSGLDVKIEDPLALARFPQGLPRVVPGEPVKVTLWAADETDLAFLFQRRGRMRMAPGDEPGTFVGGFLAPDHPGPFHFGVNLLDRGTLLDREAPYDSEFWGVLALAIPQDVAAGD